MSFDRVLPRPPALFDEPGSRLLHRQSSSLLEHKIMNVSDRTRAAAMSLVSVREIPITSPTNESDNCSTALSQMQLSAINREQAGQNGQLTASFSVSTTRQNTPVVATVESISIRDRSGSGSPTRLESAKETTSRFCLCQPNRKIPRPRNAFILYRQHYQAAVVAQNPGLANPEISKIIGEQWRALPVESKEQWKSLAEAEKARHQQQYPGYRYQPRRFGRDNYACNGLNSNQVGSTTCNQCGGRLMNFPSTPHTPLTASLPPQSSCTVDAVSPHPGSSSSSSSSSSTSSRGSNKLDRRPNESLIPTDSDGPIFNNQWREPESAILDSKRRRLNNNALQRTASPETEPYSLSSQKTYVSRPGVAYFRSHVDALSNIGNLRHSQQQPPRHEGESYYDPSLTLPPLKSDSNSASPSTTTRVQADTVMTIPVLNKINVLAKISPPLSERDNSPSRGAVIAVEGQDPTQVKVMMKYLGQLLTDDGKYVVRVFEGPDVLARKRSVSGEMKDATVDYLNVIFSWHRISDEIIQFISPKSPPQASNDSTTTCSAESPESSGSSPSSLTLSQSSTSQIPIALVPRYQLTTADAFACSIPNSDCYKVLEHWQWMASLWRACIGPDVTVYIRECDREEIERYGPSNPVEVRINEARTLIVRRVPEPSKDIEEKALKRVGFEIEDFLTPYSGQCIGSNEKLSTKIIYFPQEGGRRSRLDCNIEAVNESLAGAKKPMRENGMQSANKTHSLVTCPLSASNMAPAALADAGFPFLSGIGAYNDNNAERSAKTILGLDAIIPPQSDTSQSSGFSSVTDSFLKTTSIIRSIPTSEDLTTNSQYLPVGILRRHVHQDAGAPSAQLADKDFLSLQKHLSNLQKHGWIQIRWNTYESHPDWMFARVFVLPHDVARVPISRTSNILRKGLRAVMAQLDRSPSTWNGEFDTGSVDKDKNAADEDSLWYIFNTLNNPNPTIDDVKDADGRLAMHELMASSREAGPEARESSGVIGLKTPLHPYQCRSAATMIQREVQPKQMLDPRLEVCRTPLGQEYFYDKEEGTLLRIKRIYEEACGGILAETMGCGKTLICLAVILSTRGHFPRIPTEYQETQNPIRNSVGSLMQMAAATAGRFSVPWPSHFRRLREMGVYYARCEEECERQRGQYTIPSPPSRYTSRGGWMSRPPAVRLRLISSTLIVVPPNLVDHWQSEIASHTEGLNVLVLRSRNDKTPSEEELLKYDIILFARTRFEKEAGEPDANRHASPIATAESPLKKFHWLRIIVDEGHNVAGHGYKSNTMHMLDKLHVERRWVVSGTPSNGLYGAELNLASHQRLASDTSSGDDMPSSVLHSRRKTGTAIDEELKDVDSLRLIVVEFLKHKPWANSRNDDSANWAKYTKPVGEDGKRRKASSLRAVLQGLVVRHRLDVINDELPLPRLHNKVVSLEPTFYDKMSINLFLFNLTVNAITSERKDQDYMFQSRNRKHLSILINHLRQAGFWWTGHKPKDIQSTIDVAEKYMANNIEKMTVDDIQLLSEGLRIAHRAVASESFSAFCHSDELGVYVQGFPEHAREYWSLTSTSNESKPLLLGISQARLAQTFITSHLAAEDPAEGLAGAGIGARRQLLQRSEKKAVRTESSVADSLTHKNKPSENRSPKKIFLKVLSKKLSPDSPLSQTKLIATTSAKLTYLLDRVQELHKEEKIIIFYENNNTAFWIAEGLEMLGIDFRIYANTLKTSQKAAYLSLFEESSSVRVLLMDLRQASHGLHIASASRVFIVNPIWRPQVESQAIKRAHRIGQTRPVFVETLVLKDTLEEKMLHRRQEMSNSEMQHAEKDMLDDSTMSTIIQHERFYKLPENDEFIEPAYLQEACGFFDRHELPIPDDYVEHHSTKQSSQSPSTPSKKRKVSLLTQEPLSVQQGEIDLSPDLSPPAKRTKKVSKFQIVTENGIIMTPPRGSSKASRSPPSTSHQSPNANPVDVSDSDVGEGTMPSLFGGDVF
ncbi:SNF2 family helicase, putative [Talaromyces stipitatus ATCC 10500]|uniref:SNF2 family helicase, putative n=1 Tax=Talaromyces stipitatus (strain ATCC 10500 / CBS 375.48 / QM 6759 / NRRL 1006) TaxID=441959 RepID=B8LWN7_TALSN|nr:SNF2 family helicase, putative [Talaromyces stipitatus ATCC 10500]EED24434.1 SNF2 family helicase, putative [Talaromyces stipitatus ATCC 10500]